MTVSLPPKLMTQKELESEFNRLMERLRNRDATVADAQRLAEIRRYLAQLSDVARGKNLW